MAEENLAGTEDSGTPAGDQGGQEGQQEQGGKDQGQQKAEGAQDQNTGEGDKSGKPEEGTKDQNQQGPVSKETDWVNIRTKVANGDEKVEKRLSRYSSVESAIEALIAAQNKISDGSLKSSLPKGATAEQIATWREENGIPATPEEYDVKDLPDGIVVGEADKPLVDEFLKVSHSQNKTPEQVRNDIAWYLKAQEKQIEERTMADLKAQEVGDEAVREAWGTEYKVNKNLIINMLGTMPEDVKDQFMYGRLADGTPLTSSPSVLRWLADTARKLNPMGTIIPGAGETSAAAIDNEISNIKKMMGDKTSEYWKGDKAAKLQARFRELVELQQKVR